MARTVNLYDDGVLIWNGDFDEMPVRFQAPDGEVVEVTVYDLIAAGGPMDTETDTDYPLFPGDLPPENTEAENGDPATFRFDELSEASQQFAIGKELAYQRSLDFWHQTPPSTPESVTEIIRRKNLLYLASGESFILETCPESSGREFIRENRL